MPVSVLRLKSFHQSYCAPQSEGECVCAYLNVSEGGSKNSVQQRKARKKLMKRHIFALCKYLAKARQVKFLCMHISQKCDSGERCISLLVFRCGSCQLETS